MMWNAKDINPISKALHIYLLYHTIPQISIDLSKYVQFMLMYYLYVVFKDVRCIGIQTL